MIDPNAMRGIFDIFVNVTKAVISGFSLIVGVFRIIFESIQKFTGALSSVLFWIPGIGTLIEAMNAIIVQIVNLIKLFEDMLKWCLEYADAITYLFALFAMGLGASKIVGFSVIVQYIPPLLIAAAIIIPISPIAIFAYYALSKKQSPRDSIESTKDDVFGFIPFCLTNFDVLFYLITLITAGTLLTYPILLQYMQDLMPNFIFWDLMILIAVILLGPIALWVYYSFIKSQGMLPGLTTTRNTINSWWTNFVDVLKTIFQIKTPPPPDPNPELTDMEKHLFGQLYSDAPLPEYLTDKVKFTPQIAMPGTAKTPYDRLTFRQLNYEFYGSQDYQKALYPDYWQKNELMTRMEYICIPYFELSNQAKMQAKIEDMMCRLVDYWPDPGKGVRDIPDATLIDYSKGKLPCILKDKDNKNIIGSATQQMITDSTTKQLRLETQEEANSRFIYDIMYSIQCSLIEVGSAYDATIERLNIFFDKYDADNRLNPYYNLSSKKLMEYQYTYSNRTKQIVIASDYDRNAILPTGNNGVLSAASLKFTDAYEAALTKLKQAAAADSSANLFAMTDTIYELVASGIDITSLLGLYKNTRLVAVTSLFDLNRNASNPLYILKSGNVDLESKYNLSAAGQVNTSLATLINKAVNKAMIAQAISAAPTANVDKVKDVGLYIKRVFFDASALLSQIYATLSGIIQDCILTGSGTGYKYDPSDPIDMAWFRYTVQNWSSSENGGDNNQRDNYIAGGYTTKERELHTRGMTSVLDALENAVADKTYRGATIPGIKTKVFDLLDYVIGYNRIIDKSFSDGTIGTEATNLRRQLKSVVSPGFFRLDQNNRCMSLISLADIKYSHFHINVPMGIIKYNIDDTGYNTRLSQAITNFSDIGQLGKFLNDAAITDPGYAQFKNEVANAFICKCILDLLWWPHFCSNYYYPYSHGRHRFHDANKGPGLFYGGFEANKYDGGFKYNPLLSTTTASKIAYGLLLTEMDTIFRDWSANFISYCIGWDGNGGALRNRPNLKTAANNQGYNPTTEQNEGGIVPELFSAMCKAYRHDAMLGYVFWTITIRDQATPGLAHPNREQDYARIPTFDDLTYTDTTKQLAPFVFDTYAKFNQRHQDYGYSGTDWHYEIAEQTNDPTKRFGNTLYDLFMDSFIDPRGRTDVLYNIHGQWLQDFPSFRKNESEQAQRENWSYVKNNWAHISFFYPDKMGINYVDQYTTIVRDARPSWSWLSKRTSIGGVSMPPNTGLYYSAKRTTGEVDINVSDSYLPAGINMQTYYKFAAHIEHRNMMRLKFFANPLSFFDLDKSYQLYPISTCPTSWTIDSEAEAPVVYDANYQDNKWRYSYVTWGSSSQAYAPLIQTDFTRRLS